MVVSHKHRFIFLKTRKTAGSSIEVVLSAIAGDDAIVTPLSPAEASHEPRNFHAKKKPNLGSGAGAALRRMLLDAGTNHNYDLYADSMPYVPYYNHMPAWMVRLKLGDDIWNSYFRFCFERNPWEKVVSWYCYLHRDNPEPPSFEDWLSGRSDDFSDWFIYSLRDECAVSRIGRYESVRTDLESCLLQSGVDSVDLSLPRAKAGFRRENYFYSQSGAEQVGHMFSREIEMFGYECPPSLLDGCGSAS